MTPELVTWCPLEPALQGALWLIHSAANGPLLSGTQHTSPSTLLQRDPPDTGQVSWPACVLLSQKVLQSQQHKAGRAAPHPMSQPGPGNSNRAPLGHGQTWPTEPEVQPWAKPCRSDISRQLLGFSEVFSAKDVI